MTGSASAYVRHPDAAWRRTLGRVLVLPPGGDDVLEITGSGCAVWLLLAEPVGLDELAEEVAALYQLPPSDVASDVEEVLQSLVGADVVIATGVGPSGSRGRP